MVGFFPTLLQLPPPPSHNSFFCIKKEVFFGFFFLHEHIYFLVLYEYLPWFITKVNKYMYLFFHFSSKLVFKQMCPNLTTYTKRTTMLMLHLVNFKFPSKVDRASDINRIIRILETCFLLINRSSVNNRLKAVCLQCAFTIKLQF